MNQHNMYLVKHEIIMLKINVQNQNMWHYVNRWGRSAYIMIFFCSDNDNLPIITAAVITATPVCKRLFSGIVCCLAGGFVQYSEFEGWYLINIYMYVCRMAKLLSFFLAL